MTYIPSRAISNGSVTLQSTGEAQGAGATRCLTLHPLDPGFYVRVTAFTDPWEGLAHELRVLSAEADNRTSLLHTSDPTLLKVLVSSHAKADGQPPPPHTFFSKLVAWVRGPTFMDRFVLSSVSPSSQRTYFLLLVREWATATFAFGSSAVLDTYCVLVGAAARWGIIHAISCIAEAASAVKPGHILAVPAYLTVLYFFRQVEI